ncbi:DUF6270 domain-containing protein [Neobacillus mesonae]|uniref:DUF6270 domain-containing protein n=1 Tax=Neobacillus mesonae TaxID=1193713 RepID=UPI00082C90CB|nr:DUF6270 domain-containing protein [Neobacillus mesonae]
MIIENISIFGDTLMISFDELADEKIMISNKLEDRVAPTVLPKIYNLSHQNNNVRINIKDLLEKFSKSTRLQLYVLSRESNRLIDYSSSEINELIKKKETYIVKVVCNQNKLFLDVEFPVETLNAEVKQISHSKFQFIGKGDFSGYIVSARKRISGNVFDYFPDDIEIPIIDNSFSVDMSRLTATPIYDGDIYDFYLKNEKNDYFQIRVNNLEGKFYKVNQSMKFKFYKTGRETLAIHFSPSMNFYAMETIITPNTLTVKINQNFNQVIPNGIIKSILIINYSEKGYLKTDFLEFELKEGIEFSQFQIPLDIAKLCEGFSNRYFLLGIKVQEENKQFVHLIKYTNSGGFISSIDGLEISGKDGIQNECVIQCLKVKSNKPINLAILGSCYTRRLFSSNAFFNKEYKNRYEIVLTQFHSSLISLADDKNTKFNPELFSGFHPIALDYVKTDFEKSFFQKLRDTKPDYFLMDAYTDFQMGTFIFPDGRKVTGSTYIQKRGDFLLTENLEGVRYISPYNCSNFFDIWQESAKLFCEKLIKVIPEEKMIIHFINPNTKYKDKSGNIKNYSSNLNRTKSLIFIADYMHNYLKKLLPKAQTIDSRYLPYIGDESTPDGLLIHHFESGYYKEVLKLIDEAIVKAIAANKS